MARPDSTSLEQELARLNSWYEEVAGPESVWYWYVFRRPNGKWGVDGMHSDIDGCAKAKRLIAALSMLQTPVEHYLLTQAPGGDVSLEPFNDTPNVAVNEDAIKTLNDMHAENVRRRAADD